jgi:hypothetical protein
MPNFSENHFFMPVLNSRDTSKFDQKWLALQRTLQIGEIIDERTAGMNQHFW